MKSLTVNGWDYVQLIDVYQKAGEIARATHVPVLIHVQELTQPQGHSTSGSHERYKDHERLQWEKEFDCIVKMREWILNFELETSDGELLKFINSEEELILIDREAKKEVANAKRDAWNTYLNEIKAERKNAIQIIENAAQKSSNKSFLLKYTNDLAALIEPIRKDIFVALRKSLRLLKDEDSEAKKELQKFIKTYSNNMQEKYSSHLTSETAQSVLKISPEQPRYAEEQN